MVWPNRGAFGAIGGYDLNVLKLLQDSHRCCRYAPAACLKKTRKTIRQAQAPSPVFFIEAPGRPVFRSLLPPGPNRGRAGRQGSNWTRGPRPSRHRGLSKSCVLACRSGSSEKAKRAASPPNPRRPARGVYRFAPKQAPVVASHSRLPVGASPRHVHRAGP